MPKGKLKDPDFDAEYARSQLAYDPETGALTWKVWQGGGAPKVGAPAGCRSTQTGYLLVRLKSRLCVAHRVIWLMQTGEWPKAYVDHRDTDRTNNRWANLREASKRQNGWNRGKPRTNTSGYKGVYLNRGRWHAQITIDGRVTFLGNYDTPAEGHAAYAAASAKHHGEFGRLE